MSTDNRIALAGENDCLFTTKEAARYLRVSHRTMEDWRYKGGGPSFSKAGKRILYRKGDLDAFLTARTFQNTAEAKMALRQVQHQTAKVPAGEPLNDCPF